MDQQKIDIRGVETNAEQIVTITLNHRGGVLLCSLSISSRVVMELTMGTLVMWSNVLRTKSEFVFVSLVGGQNYQGRVKLVSP